MTRAHWFSSLHGALAARGFRSEANIHCPPGKREIYRGAESLGYFDAHEGWELCERTDADLSRESAVSNQEES